MRLEAEIEARFASLERRVGELEHLVQSTAPRGPVAGKVLSIREFMISKNPKTDVDRTLVVGYYLETHGNISPFNLGDLRGAFAQAKEQLPVNLSDAVNKNIQKGLVMEVPNGKDGFKAWVLTNSGEKQVASKERGGS
jgi:hypothetical protein